MTATVDAVLTTTQGDGGGLGKTITTPAGMSGKRVLAFIGSSSNADTIGAPATGTWAEVDPSGDKLITTSGGQLRTFEGRNLSSSTSYSFTASGGRLSLGAVVLSGEDDSGASMVDVSASLESAAASTHAPPSVTPTASGELVVDCMMFRQFNPDTSTCSPPSTGLTWTERADFRGADGNNNIQIAINSATAGSSGVAISTAALNTDDPFEPAMVMRVVIKSAAGAGGVAPNGLAVPVALGSPTAAQAQTAAPSGLAVPVALGQPTATRQSAAPSGLAVPVALGTPTVTRQSAAPNGLAIAVALGQPSTSIPAAAPAGLAVPVSLGTPQVSPGAFPAGLAVPVVLGQPSVALARTAVPNGLVVPVTLGAAAATVGRSAASAGLAIPVTLGLPAAGTQAPYSTAVLTPGAAPISTFTPGVVAPPALTPAAVASATLSASAAPVATWTPGAIEPATLTAGGA